jgi:hypothetical protein
MNGQVEVNLALILFLPWFAILGYLYWRFPRQPRPRARKVYDAIALVVAVAAAAVGMHWSFRGADASYGAMWRQVLATSVAYGVFLGVMLVAVVVRAFLFPRPPGGKPVHSRVPGTHHQ